MYRLFAFQGPHSPSFRTGLPGPLKGFEYKKHVRVFLLSVLVFPCPDPVQAHGEEQALAPLTTGLFSLSSSQQTGPLISFGQNIIDKGVAQLSLLPDMSEGSNSSSLEIAPSGVYGLQDDLALMFSVPLSLSDKEGDVRRSGIEFFSLTGEYAPYARQTGTYAEQMTLVLSGTLPHDLEIERRLPPALASSSFFVGTTFNRMYEGWWAFTSNGINATIYNQGNKTGNSLLYQAGMGRNIASASSSYIFASLLEITGTYTGKTRQGNVLIPDSGGNTVYVTPSLWYSTPKFIAQLGISFPLVQHLFGDQKPTHYVLSGNFGWTF